MAWCMIRRVRPLRGRVLLESGMFEFESVRPHSKPWLEYLVEL
jgi:hypothetical protein